MSVHLKLSAAAAVIAWAISFPSARAGEAEADALFDAKKFPQAVAEYDKALLTAPNSPKLLVNKGLALLTLKRWDAAVESFQAALRIDAKLAPAQAGIAMAEYQREHYRAATQAFVSAIALAPENPDYRAGLDAAAYGIEVEFIKLIQHYKNEYDTAPNDIIAKQIPARLDAAICESNPEGVAFRWRGTLRSLYDNANGSGSALVKIEIADRVTVETIPVLCPACATTTRTGSPVWTALSKHKTGDAVVFSGRFIRKKDACAGQYVSSMRSQNFIMKFEDLE